MTFGEERLVLLDCSLQASLFQVLTNSLYRERLVGDVAQLSGDLNSSICLARAEKSNSMANVAG